MSTKDERARLRADDAPPEETRPGSDVPEAQAAAILADSDRREATRQDSGDQDSGDQDSGDTVEHHPSSAAATHDR